MSLPVKSQRELVKRLILAEILARPGEGPLARRDPRRALLEQAPSLAQALAPEKP